MISQTKQIWIYLNYLPALSTYCFLVNNLLNTKIFEATKILAHQRLSPKIKIITCRQQWSFSLSNINGSLTICTINLSTNQTLPPFNDGQGFLFFFVFVFFVPAINLYTDTCIHQVHVYCIMQQTLYNRVVIKYICIANV